MRAAVWLLAVVAAMGCKVVTSPDSGGAAGDVIVGNTFYTSVRNGSQNPAVDTVAVRTTVEWKWGADGSHLGVHGSAMTGVIVVQ